MAGYLVIGAGKFGRSIAKTLYRHNETVLVIDKNEELIQQIIDDGTVREAVSFDVTEENSLKKMVNSDDFEVAFICIEGSLQTSALVTVMLKELGIKTIICKAITKIEGKVLEKIGATKVAFPDETVGIDLAFEFLKPDVTEHLKFSEKYRIFEFKVPKRIIGKNLIELNLRKKYEMNVIGIKRESEELRISLLPDEKILENDMLLVIANVEKMIQFNKEYLEN